MRIKISSLHVVYAILLIFLFGFLLDSCATRNILIVTTDFWWRINNRGNVLVDSLKKNLKGENFKFVFDVRQLTDQENLDLILKSHLSSTELKYSYYVFTPVVSKWITLYGRAKNQKSSTFSLIAKKGKGRFIFLVTEESGRLSSFDNVTQVIMKQKGVFVYGAEILKGLLKNNDAIKDLYKEGESCCIGVIYYAPHGEKPSRIAGFEGKFAKGKVLCLEKRLDNTENKIKARLAFEELRDNGVKIFLFDAYSLNPYLISLAEKNDVVYIVNYVKNTSFHRLLFSFDYDYAKLITDALVRLGNRNDGTRKKILTEMGFIWWGNYIKIPEEYKNNGIIKG